ncbi:MAG: hypothetical protein FJ087_19230 [Deltaproteobacteria bacterium]|nr:hypothetical protein [Deltaproteobacteria bacterium]
MRKSLHVAVFLVSILALPALAGPPAARPVQALSPEQLKAMSLEQMLESGEKMVGDMKRKSEDVIEAFAEAQKVKDFVRINCVSETLTTIKGLMRLSEENMMTLKIRVIARDRNGAEHEFVKLTIASGKVSDMHAQAKGCGGPAGETMFEGSPLVEKRFDKDLPVEEGRSGLEVVVIVLNPPPSATPYY